MIIRYCLNLASKSPSFYDDIRYDKNNDTDFLVLPSRRRLRDYKNYIHPTSGFNIEIIAELTRTVKNFSEQEKYCVLLMGEMKIQEDLVWDKHTEDLIGYVNLGDSQLNYATLKKSDDITSHVLVFPLRSIVNPLKFTLANFDTKNVTSLQLFPLLWKAVGILEGNDPKVMAVTSDGRMHSEMKHTNNDKGVVYKTRNIYADDNRDIFFNCDEPHIVKTARNNVAHSGFDNNFTKLLWNSEYYITWCHIFNLMMEDLECGLQLCPKITTEHIQLTPFSLMNVRLAAQVLSSSVSIALESFGTQEAAGTALYCEIFDKFFDCLNVRNCTEHITKQEPFLKPYSSINDERVDWLLHTVLTYFTNWKESIESRPRIYTKK